MKKKKLNAESMKIEKRVSALETKVEATSVAKNLLEKEMDAALEKLDAGAARIEGRRLRCRGKTKSE